MTSRRGVARSRSLAALDGAIGPVYALAEDGPMQVVEVFVTEGIAPGRFALVAGIANERILETLSGYDGFVEFAVFVDEGAGTSFAHVTFRDERALAGASKALDQLSRVVALALEARAARRYRCTVAARTSAR